MLTGDDDMKRITLEFVSDGFRDLLCSEPVKEQVEQAAERIADMATSSATRSKPLKKPARYIVKGPKLGNYGGGRWIAYVAADTKPAVWDAIYNHRLETVIWEANL